MSKKKEQGFVMLESLVSLSILALFVGVVFPFSLDVLIIREQAKRDVELSRFLYESAQFYKIDEPDSTVYRSGDVQAHSIETSRSIQIFYGEEKVKEITFSSADW